MISSEPPSKIPWDPGIWGNYVYSAALTSEAAPKVPLDFGIRKKIWIFESQDCLVSTWALALGP